VWAYINRARARRPTAATRTAPATSASALVSQGRPGRHVVLFQQLSGMQGHALRPRRLVYAQPILPGSGSPITQVLTVDFRNGSCVTSNAGPHGDA
jgi:hypothetical protein